MKNMWVYIMANEKKTIYTGVTNNLERRIWEHRNGLGSAFARDHGCTNLVYIEEFVSPIDAIAREKNIKGMVRSRKIALIEATNPNWSDLSQKWTQDTPLVT